MSSARGPKGLPAVALGLLLLLPSPAGSQEPPCEIPEEEPAEPGIWAPTLAHGTNYAWNVAADPTDPSRVLLAGARIGPIPGGAYLSTDGGSTWSRGEGISGAAHTLAAAFSPADPDVLYAGVDVGGGIELYRSIDGGRFWCPTASWGSSHVELLVDPRSPETVWAGRGDGKLMRSDDQGATWTEAGAGLPAGQQVNALAAGPTTQDVLAATNDGVFRSRDGGATFARSDGGLARHPYPLNPSLKVRDLARDPRNPLTVFAPVYEASFIGGICFVNERACEQTYGDVYVSDDFGATWEPLPHPVYADNQDHHGGKHCVAGAQFVTTVAVDDAGTLVGGGGCGVWTTRDRGESWAFLGEVPGNLSIRRVEAGPEGAVWASTFAGGVFASHDGAFSFERVSPGWGGGFSVFCKLAPLGKGHLLAACGTSFRRYDVVMRSGDAGATWLAVGDLHEGGVIDVAPDARFPNVVLASTHAGGFYRSTDWGTTWRPLAGLPLFGGRLAAAPGRSGTVYAAAAAARGAPANPLAGEHLPGGIWRSRDAGLAWQPTGAFPGGPVTALAVSPDDPRVLIAGGLEGVWRSDDSGLTWVRASGVAADPITAVGFVPGNPKVVLAGGDRLYRSTDAGRTFTQVAGMPSLLRPQGFTGRPGVVYLSGSSGPILRSNDDGATWVEIDESGLFGPTMRAIWADPDSDGYYAVSGEAGANWPFRTATDP